MNFSANLNVSSWKSPLPRFARRSWFEQNAFESVFFPWPALWDTLSHPVIAWNGIMFLQILLGSGQCLANCMNAYTFVVIRQYICNDRFVSPSDISIEICKGKRYMHQFMLYYALGISITWYCITREHIDNNGSWQRSSDSTTFSTRTIYSLRC